jgi:hypothetical protein
MLVDTSITQTAAATGGALSIVDLMALYPAQTS